MIEMLYSQAIGKEIERYRRDGWKRGGDREKIYIYIYIGEREKIQRRWYRGDRVAIERIDPLLKES